MAKGGRKVGSKNNKLDIKIDLEPLDFLQKRLSDVDAKEIRWGYFDKIYTSFPKQSHPCLWVRANISNFLESGNMDSSIS